MCLSIPYGLVLYLYSKVRVQRHGKNNNNNKIPYLQQQRRSTSRSCKSVPRAKHAAALSSTFQMEEVCKVISPARGSVPAPKVDKHKEPRGTIQHQHGLSASPGHGAAPPRAEGPPRFGNQTPAPGSNCP